MIGQPKVAVYSTLHSKRDNRAIELLLVFCVLNGLNCTFYLDKTIPKEGESSNWQRFLEDIAKGSYQAAITWLSAPGVKEYCEHYNTRFEIVDPFAFSVSLRSAKVDIRSMQR